MSGKAKNQEIGARGGSITLDVKFYEYEGGNLVDDDNYASLGTKPIVKIYDAIDYVNEVETGEGTRLSTGSYTYKYTISETATISDEWKIKWEITINGAIVTFEEYFRVVEAGGVEFGDDDKRDIPDTDNIIALRQKIADWKGGDDTNWVFYNSELQTILTQSIYEHTGGTTEEDASYEDISLSLILSHASICELLATDTGKFFKYKEGVSGDEVDKSMTPETFIKLAAHLRNYYGKKMKQKSEDIDNGTKIPNGGQATTRASFFKYGNVSQTL